jgi:carboxyl-terminal processing protease
VPDRSLLRPLALISIALLLAHSGTSQQISRIERERAQAMLQTVGVDVRKYYYDATLHGVNWDARVNETKDKIAKANSYNEAILQIAALLEALNDSHTLFAPPRDPIPQEYGWRFQMVGNHCFVTRVQPKSDAQAKGIKPGDEILTINGFAPARESLAKMEYALKTLVPQSSLRLDLRTPSGRISHVVVKARVRQPTTIMDYGDMTGRDSWRVRLEAEDELHLMRPAYKELMNGVMILKLPVFFPTDTALQEMIGKSRRNGTLVLDLRGNPGGAESNLQDLLGEMFEMDVKIADRVTRQGTKPLIAKGSHKGFTGKLIVLVDSRSASASELFARVVQIEKRGVVLGDRTLGRVMEARYYDHEIGSGLVFHYGTEISEADLVMTDGKSLEHLGVTPDETILPSATDLANNRDPVLAHAAEIAGVPLTPQQAANLFPYEWPKR